MELFNVVFVKHDSCEKTFLFSVPESVRLKAGEEVICDTIKGSNTGVCVTNNFWVSSQNDLAAVTGAYLPLKKVVGRIKKVTQKTAVMFNCESELPF